MIVHTHTNINDGSDDALDRDKADIIAALDYRSDPDSVNSVYLGSMAVGMICYAVGIKYSDQVDRREAIRNATREQIDDALQVCAGVIAHMKAHPTTTCPTCGTKGVVVKEADGQVQSQSPVTPASTLDILEASVEGAEISILTGVRYLRLDVRVLEWLITDSRILASVAAGNIPYGEPIRGANVSLPLDGKDRSGECA